MLHLDPRRAYVSAIEAAQGLQEAIAQSNVQPEPLVLSGLGIRTESVSTTPPPPVRNTVAQTITVKRAAVDPQEDLWDTPGVDTQGRFTSGPESADEDEASMEEDTAPRWSAARLKSIVKIGLVGVSLAGGFTAAQFVPAPAMFFSRVGTLSVESNPPGAALLVDGEDQGITPLTLKLKNGRHEVELRGPGKPRVFNVYISSGSRVSQYVELRGTTSRQRKIE
jgi:hypothetical protein